MAFGFKNSSGNDFLVKYVLDLNKANPSVLYHLVRFDHQDRRSASIRVMRLGFEIVECLDVGFAEQIQGHPPPRTKLSMLLVLWIREMPHHLGLAFKPPQRLARSLHHPGGRRGHWGSYFIRQRYTWFDRFTD